MKNIFFLVAIIVHSFIGAQSISILSFNQNPLEISPLLGGNLLINYNYTSEQGALNNHVYIALEILSATNTYVRTISEVTLLNQTAGTNLNGFTNLFISSINPLTASLPFGQYYQVKAILYASGGWTANAWAGYWNTPVLITQDTIGYNFSNNPIQQGVDVSWMTEMQNNGFIWKDNSGTTAQLMPLLATYNINAVRLRVWVNPSASAANGWCDILDVVNKAILAKNQGLDVMLSIHYSDHWADPATQTKPAAWNNYSITELQMAVSNHTTAVLNALQTASVTPKWVQIGNETNDGMLWTTGKASSGGFANYANFINAGTLAVKNFNSTIKTILHLANGDDGAALNWNINGLISNGLATNRLDIIGLSLYALVANWKTKVDLTYSNMLSLQSTFNKQVMIVETGFPSNNPATSYQFLMYLIEKTKLANGIGVFYWEPIAHNNWNNYPFGAWDADGSPSIAMDAFKNSVLLSNVKFETFQEINIYPNPASNLINVVNNGAKIETVEIYDFSGKFIFSKQLQEILNTIDVSPLANGIYFLRLNEEITKKFIKN